jgi:hypothetical protein
MPKRTSIYTSANRGRVDQGVDYSGAGTIPALGNAVVTDVGTTHIIETGSKIWRYVIYRLTSGPYKGKFVYVAENIIPRVHVGQKLRAGQTVAYAPGRYPYTETGFNQGPQGWRAYGNLNGPQKAGYLIDAFISGAKTRGGTSLKITKGPHAGQVKVKVNGKWYYAKNGHWIGKGPPGYPKPTESVLAQLGGAIVGGADAVVHPLAWVDKLIYAAAIAGGGFVTILGIILTAADIGLSTRAGKIAAAVPLGRTITKAARPVTSRTERKSPIQPSERKPSGRKTRIVHKHYLDDRPKEPGNYDPSTSEIPF